MSGSTGQSLSCELAPVSGQGFVIAASRDLALLAGLAARIGAKTGWERLAFDGPAAIFAETPDTFVTGSGTHEALLVGTVFPRHGPIARSGRIDEETLADLSSGSAARLLTRYWGGYLAIVWSEGRLRIIRDPSAALPCLFAHEGSATLLAPNVELLMRAGLPRPRVDIDGVADGLFRADLPSSRTALAAIEELLPGFVLDFDEYSAVTRQVWSPWEHVEIDPQVTASEHAERLRRAVQNCTASWSSLFDLILMGVSGGLDSSILAACLHARKPPPVCATLATREADGDERHYARLLCEELDLPLVEASYALADIDLGRPARPDLARPTGRLLAQGYNAAMTRIAHDHAAAAFFTGNGGDNVFAFSQSAAALADRLLQEGPGRGAWRTARDICRLTGCSLFEALRAAARILRRPRRYRWRANPRFLASPILKGLDTRPLTHPWLEPPRGALPGKAAHIAALLRIQRHLDGTGQLGSLPIVNPLMAQPVMEACLAVPSWLWCQGGRNRAIARDAFRPDLPPAITNRISKGGPDGFGAQIVRAYRKQIRERLLDGALSRHGVIDRAALAQHLDDPRPGGGTDQVRVLELLEAEAWINHWQAP